MFRIFWGNSIIHDATDPWYFIFSAKFSQLQNPVWVNADIIKGPGGGTPRDPNV